MAVELFNGILTCQPHLTTPTGRLLAIDAESAGWQLLRSELPNGEGDPGGLA
jgi:hypothetical protein